jgi:hypothetical protein
MAKNDKYKESPYNALKRMGKTVKKGKKKMESVSPVKKMKY